jgi:hypothetical protein
VTDYFSTPDDLGEIRQSDLQSSLGESLGAQAADALDPKDSPSAMWLLRRAREASAGGTDLAVGAGGDVDAYSGQSLEERQAVVDAQRAAIPDTSIDDAKARIKQEGLEGQLKLPDQPSVKSPVLDLMIAEAHERRDREVAIAKGPQGFMPGALGLITSLGAGMIDPVNMAAFSIPVLGEARMGKLMASAGDSILNRTGVRMLQGGLQGAVGTAVLQPADWWLHTQDGQDYTFADALKSVVMGAGMGAGFHAAGGLVGDIASKRRGVPLAGSPEDLLVKGLMTGRHVPGDALAEEGVTPDQLGAAFAPPQAEAPPIQPEPQPQAFEHPAQVMADLPPAAQEDVVRASIADIAADRPVRAAEMLQIAADHSPRIAESFEAWHGSPHDIDRFDSSRIGTGEGAQTYGHGLYFAENEKVATQYARSTSGRDFIRKAQELYDEHDSPGDAHAAIVESKDVTPGQKRLLLALEKDDWLGFDYPHQAVSAALSDPNGKNWEMSPETLDAIKHVGNMYRVRINAHPDHFLDWDKPLGKHPEPVRSKLRAAGFDDSQTGKDIYHSLVKYRPEQGGGTTSAGMKISDLDATPEAASGRLRATGIHGIKYLDQGSRAGIPDLDTMLAVAKAQDELATTADPVRRKELHAELAAHDAKLQPTRNFVVFDDKHIEILDRNGEPVAKPFTEALPGNPKITLGADPDLVTAPKPRGRAAAHPDTLSLNEHLASQGGLRPDPELEAIYGNKRGPFVPGFGPLIRKSGMSLDDALSSAKQHGYMQDPHDVENGTAGAGGRTSHGLTPNDLLDHLDAENRGQKLYKPGHVEKTKYDPDQEKHVIMGALETELEKSGADVSAIDPKLLDRTVEIVHREGVTDVLDAYERAIMEDEERYNAIADARQSDPVAADIPGFERSDDAGAAPGDGGRDQGGDRQTGRPDQSGGRADDSQPSSHGARAAAAAADPRWRELADVKPAEDAPDVIAESREADRLAEPDSLVPEKSLTALEKQAADAEAIWRKLEPTLTEQERTMVNDVLDQLKLDKEAREKVITDGAACLAAAFA